MAIPPKVLVLRAAGTNCEHETASVWRRVGADADIGHIGELAANPRRLTEYQILTIPGGFSYGDDLGAGRVFGAQLDRSLSDQLHAAFARQMLILGICNGFQVLVHAGLLPDPAAHSKRRAATLTANTIPGYQDRWVTLTANPASPCVFLTPSRTYELPMAHGEGRVVFRTPADLKSAQNAGLDALRFAGQPVEASAARAQTIGSRVDTHYGVVRGPRGVYLGNPNGSDGDIAGLCDATGRIFGLMPHPERFVDWTQHPAWTALPPQTAGDGLAIFEQALAVLR